MPTVVSTIFMSVTGSVITTISYGIDMISSFVVIGSVLNKVTVSVIVLLDSLEVELLEETVSVFVKTVVEIVVLLFVVSVSKVVETVVCVEVSVKAGIGLITSLHLTNTKITNASIPNIISDSSATIPFLLLFKFYLSFRL